MVQSVCLTSRGSGVRIPQLPQLKINDLQRCKSFFSYDPYSFCRFRVFSCGAAARCRYFGPGRPAACSSDKTDPPEGPDLPEPPGAVRSEYRERGRRNVRLLPVPPAEKRLSGGDFSSVRVASGADFE